MERKTSTAVTQLDSYLQTPTVHMLIENQNDTKNNYDQRTLASPVITCIIKATDILKNIFGWFLEKD